MNLAPCCIAGGPFIFLKNTGNVASVRDIFLSSLPHPLVTTHPSCGTIVYVITRDTLDDTQTHSSKPGNKISGAKMVLPGCDLFRVSLDTAEDACSSNHMHSDSQCSWYTPLETWRLEVASIIF